MMLELAIKQHQPEGRISVNLRAPEEVESKINPNANRREQFTVDCPWDEANFAQLWVNLHWAKVAFDAQDYSTALSCGQNVMQNYQIMLAPDRVKHYPDELRKYVVDSKPGADSLYKAIKEKR